MNFIGGTPAAFLTSQLVGVGITSNISDSLGNILFYTSGFDVYNRNNVVMLNGWGTAFKCSSNFNQVPLAIQQLNDITKYYLFTAGCWTSSTTLPKGAFRYSVIDMNLDGGLGGVPPGMNDVAIPGGAEGWHAVTGTRHHNNHDVWVVIRLQKSDSNYFSSYLVSAAGINFTPVFSNSLMLLQEPPLGLLHEIKNIRISRDGTKLIAVYDSIIEVCHFNSLTGHVTPMFLVRMPNIDTILQDPESAEFSVDSKILYISGATRWGFQPRGFLYQFDATKTDSAQFMQSRILLATGSYPFALQLAPDGKIYCDRYNVDSLNVINNPSIPGIGCNYQTNAADLKGRECTSGLPQFVERYYAIIRDSSFCQSNPTFFYPAIWPPPDSVHWNFGDPSSGPLNISNIANANHVYVSTGTYTIHLFVRHIDNRVDSATAIVTILIGPNVILGPDKIVCTGNFVTFDAGFWNGATYSWSNLTTHQMNISTNQLYTTNLASTYMVAVTLGNCVDRDTITLTTYDSVTVSNNPPFKSICSGDPTNILLTSNLPGTTFSWTATGSSPNVTGYSPGSTTFINQVLTNSGSSIETVTYTITPSNGSCQSGPLDYVVTVYPLYIVSNTITVSANPVCAGIPVTFTAISINGGTSPFYQWNVNGINSGTNNPVFTYTPSNGDLVKCVLTSSITVCISNNPATSNTITMIVNPNLPISVSVSPAANPVCAGTSVTFTATPTFGGATPGYQWKVNGIIVGANSNTYSYIPLNNDVITCTLTSSETCTTGNPAISNQVTMTVNPNLPVSISISATSNPFCIGNSVTFTASPTYPGTIPVYQWKVNGVNVGTNSSSYTYNPISGDLVKCVLTSSELCTSNNPATSNTIMMTGNLGLPAGVSITATPNPFCPGSSVICTATPSNGGTNPVYQWKVNGANAGTNSPIFSYNPANNDSVRCVMTSNLNCVSGNPASSNKIILSGTLAPIVTFAACFDTITTSNAKPIKLKGGIPLGGTYSGAGVSGGYYNPALAGAGTHIITYTYTNAALCSASKNSRIHQFTSSPFTCGNNLTDIRDNKVYPTVQIGSQCWMAANLNYGIEIPSTQNQRDNCVPEKYKSAVGSQQSAFYQWDELMRYDDTPGMQGLCPPGWHVPTENEWNTLFAVYTNNGFAGSPLKFSGYSGFNALLSGARFMNKIWSFDSFATYFWSSTSHGPYKAWAHGMNGYNPCVSLYSSSRVNAFSIRCLKD